MKTKIKKYFLIFLLAELFFSYSPAYAQQAPASTFNYANAGVSAQIEQFLCAPSKQTPTGNNNPVTVGGVNIIGGAPIPGTSVGGVTINGQSDSANFNSQIAAQNNGNSTDLYKCINQLYKLAIIAAISIGTFFLVIAGYIYMSAEGNQESVDKAKDILRTTITSLVILFAGWLLLHTLNPDIVNFKSIQPPSVVLDQLAAPDPDLGTGTPGGPSALVGSTVTGGNPAPQGCNNCVDYTANGLTGNSTQLPGNNTFLNQNLVAKLKQLKAAYPKLIINEAFPPTVPHQSKCHYDGTCADIGTSPKTADEANNLCKAASAAGLTVVNEYFEFQASSMPNCTAPTKFSTTTGGHLHVY